MGLFDFLKRNKDSNQLMTDAVATLQDDYFFKKPLSHNNQVERAILDELERFNQTKAHFESLDLNYNHDSVKLDFKELVDIVRQVETTCLKYNKLLFLDETLLISQISLLKQVNAIADVMIDNVEHFEFNQLRHLVDATFE